MSLFDGQFFFKFFLDYLFISELGSAATVTFQVLFVLIADPFCIVIAFSQIPEASRLHIDLIDAGVFTADFLGAGAFIAFAALFRQLLHVLYLGDQSEVEEFKSPIRVIPDSSNLTVDLCPIRR